jgi:hypothetical protein
MIRATASICRRPSGPDASSALTARATASGRVRMSIVVGLTVQLVDERVAARQHRRLVVIEVELIRPLAEPRPPCRVAEPSGA